MSLILAGLIAAGASGAVFVGRWLSKRKDGPTNKLPAGDMKDLEEKKDEPLVGFPCQLGDVLMRVTGEEAWLAGGLVLSEDVPVAVLFVAPDAGTDCAIYARPPPHESVFWLVPLDPKAVLVGGEPPTSVEHEGVRFDRVRRLPLRTKRLGVGAPDVGASVIIAEYTSSGSERLLVMKSGADAHAYRGLELDPALYEVIASGRATL